MVDLFHLDALFPYDGVDQVHCLHGHQNRRPLYRRRMLQKIRNCNPTHSLAKKNYRLARLQRHCN